MHMDAGSGAEERDERRRARETVGEETLQMFGMVVDRHTTAGQQRATAGSSRGSDSSDSPAAAAVAASS